MARKIIKASHLRDKINEHLEKFHECRNLRISTVVSDPARTHGANWSTSDLRRSGGDHDQVECSEAIETYMRDLQSKYDIE